MKFTSFFCGIIFGVWLEQKYMLPKVDKVIDMVKEQLDKYERND